MNLPFPESPCPGQLRCMGHIFLWPTKPESVSNFEGAIVRLRARIEFAMKSTLPVVGPIYYWIER